MRHAIFIKQCILRGQSTSNERLISHVSKSQLFVNHAKKKYKHMKKYIELDGEVYCKSCIQIVINEIKALRSPRKAFSYIIDQLALLKLQLCLYVPMIDLHQYVRSGRKLLFVCKLGDVSLAF